MDGCKEKLVNIRLTSKTTKKYSYNLEKLQGIKGFSLHGRPESKEIPEKKCKKSYEKGKNLFNKKDIDM